MVTCTYCGGEGFTFIEEDNSKVRHACYHCSTTGKVEEEVAFEDKVREVANILGAEMAAKIARMDDEFSLKAGEAGVSTYHYQKDIENNCSDEVFADLTGMSKVTLEALVSHMLAPKEEVIEVPVKLAKSWPLNDDIPF